MGREEESEQSQTQWRMAKTLALLYVLDRSLASVHKKFFSPWVSNHLAFICLLTPNSKWTEASHNEVPLFSKQHDFIFLLFRLAKRKNAEDCSSIECNYGRVFVFLFFFFFNYWLFLCNSVIFQEFFFHVERSSGKAAGIILSLWLIVHKWKFSG